jgi:hypothetical protein
MLSSMREKAEQLAIDFLTKKKNPKHIDVDGVVLDGATGLWHVKGRLEDNKGVTCKFLVRIIGDDEVYDWTLSEA